MIGSLKSGDKVSLVGTLGLYPVPKKGLKSIAYEPCYR